MATIKHARTIALQATSPRIVAVPLPTNITADWTTNVTGTGKPADSATVNRIQTGTSFAGTPVNGDIWIDTNTSPAIVKTRVSGAWVSSANYTTNTTQLTDGAGLGTTADWGSVYGTGKPASYADVTASILSNSGTAIVMTAANLFKSSAGSGGVFIGAGGLIGKTTGGVTTFSIDATTGAAMFAGSMSAAHITSGTLTSASVVIPSSAGGNLIDIGYNSTVISYRELTGYNINAGNLSSPGASAITGTSSTAAAGMHGKSTASGGHGVRGEAGTALGFVGYSYGTYDFYAAGLGTYGPFTGSHDALVPKGTALEVGDIVCDLDVAVRKGVSDTICVVARSTAPGQGAAVGVVCALARNLEMVHQLPAAMMERFWSYPPEAEPIENVNPVTEWYALRLTHDAITINALGEGMVNVTGEGGNLLPGDLITTSSTPGKGMRQADDVVRASSVAKCREAVTFDNPDQVRMVACIYLCG